MESISLIIKELRNKKNLSQEEVARILNIKPQSVSKWEKGQTVPRMKQLPKLAEILGVPISALSGNVKGVESYSNIHQVPILKRKPSASFIDLLVQEGFVVEETYPVYYSPGEEPKENQIVFIIDGDSMANQVKNGSKVLFEEVSDGNINFINSGIYAVIFDSQFVIKQVKENDIYRTGYLTLYSDDGTNSYFQVKRDLIRKVWRAIRIIDQKL